MYIINWISVYTCTYRVSNIYFDIIVNGIADAMHVLYISHMVICKIFFVMEQQTFSHNVILRISYTFRRMEPNSILRYQRVSIKKLKYEGTIRFEKDILLLDHKYSDWQHVTKYINRNKLLFNLRQMKRNNYVHMKL